MHNRNVDNVTNVNNIIKKLIDNTRNKACNTLVDFTRNKAHATLVLSKKPTPAKPQQHNAPVKTQVYNAYSSVSSASASSSKNTQSIQKSMNNQDQSIGAIEDNEHLFDEENEHYLVKNNYYEEASDYHIDSTNNVNDFNTFEELMLRRASHNTMSIADNLASKTSHMALVTSKTILRSTNNSTNKAILRDMIHLK
ncbi:20542_t:CDS:2 [Cetraspora pellucida]|uniref:20542_t:CDS:1 n=1 Tax=Cetraspora pellucida TaxID=1433469 RepID=A0A9N9JEM2_9GLOM|nr:20542_t:CDS:2 [Cetraspora pellucida]